MAIAVTPKDRVAAAEHNVIGAGAAHERLMEIVAYGVLVGQALQDGDIAKFDVVERHRIATTVVVNRRGIVKNRVELISVGGDHEGIKVAQAAGGVLARGVVHAAIGLLPHLEQPVGCIAGVRVVGKPPP